MISSTACSGMPMPAVECVARLLVLVCAVAGAAAADAAVQVSDGAQAAAVCRVEVPAAGPLQRTGGPSSRLSASDVATGTRDIAAVWFGSPTERYAHAALGTRTHAGSLHARLRGGGREVILRLPQDRVFEDRVPRVVDLDGDGRDEVVIVESSAGEGAALVAYGIEMAGETPRWVERARSEAVGNMRWLNPVGFADFQGDATLEIASVSTPHIGGILTLYRYAPPRLEVLGRLPGVSNHRYGSPDQRMAAVLRTAAGPVVVVPDSAYAELRLLAWNAAKGWHDVSAPLPLVTGVSHIVQRGRDVCVSLPQGSWLLLRGR
jgi:hypothetical protein